MAPADLDRRYAAIFVGGVIGAVARWWGVGLARNATSGSHVVLIVNVVGCMTLGIVMAEEWRHPNARLWLHDFGGIGFCGGLTTFSSVAVDSAVAFGNGHVTHALWVLVSNAVFGCLVVFASAGVFRRTKALILPLEGRP